MISKIDKGDLAVYKQIALFSLIIVTLLFFKIGFNLDFLFISILAFVMVVLSFIDLKYKAVPDYLLLFIFILSFFLTSFSLLEALKNAFLVSGAMVLLNFVVTFYIQNIKSRILKDDSLKTQEALGEGDIPVIATFAVILGLEATVFTIFFAAVIAIIQYIYVNFTKKEREIPFIPALTMAFFLEYLFSISSFLKDFF